MTTCKQLFLKVVLHIQMSLLGNGKKWSCRETFYIDIKTCYRVSTFISLVIILVILKLSELRALGLLRVMYFTPPVLSLLTNTSSWVQAEWEWGTNEIKCEMGMILWRGTWVGVWQWCEYVHAVWGVMGITSMCGCDECVIMRCEECGCECTSEVANVEAIRVLVRCCLSTTNRWGL